MIDNIQFMYTSAELALAAYASLTSNSPTAQASNIAALKQAGFSAKQAEEFAKKYPEILAQYTDTPAEGGLGTSFSATVFKDTAGNLTLAIRGTAELDPTVTPNDFLPGGATGAFERFRLADGQTLSWQQLIGVAHSQIISRSTGQFGAMLVGGALNDSLTGTGGGSTFSGGRGDDGSTESGSLRRWPRTSSRRPITRPNAYNFRQIERKKQAA